MFFENEVNLSDQLYIHPHVEMVRNLHKKITTNVSESTSVVSYLNKISENLYQAFLDKDEASHVEFRNHHYFFIGKSAEVILNASISIDDVHRAVAKEYGFDNWDRVLEHGNQRFNMGFEHLINAMLEGRIDEVIELVSVNPKLVEERSPFYHRANILHYASANGVEIHRQIVPQNIAEIVNILVTKNADKHALANFYDTRLEPYLLAESSAHIRMAGVRDELLELLKISD